MSVITVASQQEIFDQHFYLLIIAVIGVFLIRRETSNYEITFKYVVFPVLVMLWAFFDAAFNRFLPGDTYVTKQEDQDTRVSLPRIQLGIFESIIFLLSVYFLKFRYNVGALVVLSYIWALYLIVIGIYHSIYTILDPNLKYSFSTFWKSFFKVVGALFIILFTRKISHKL